MYLEKTEKHTTYEFLVYEYDYEMGTLSHIYFKFMAINEINIYFYLRTVNLLKIWPDFQVLLGYNLIWVTPNQIVNRTVWTKLIRFSCYSVLLWVQKLVN